MRPRAWLYLARLLVICFGLGAVAALLVLEEGCTPGQRDVVNAVVPPLQRATCVFVRALTTDGRALEACATADELAPFLSELLEARASEPPDPPEARPIVAFSISPPKRKVARRRCAQWVAVPPPVASLDGATDAAPLAKGDGGDGGP